LFEIAWDTKIDGAVRECKQAVVCYQWRFKHKRVIPFL